MGEGSDTLGHYDQNNRVIYRADHRSYDLAKTQMIGQNLFARSS